MSNESPDPAPTFEESMAELEDCVARLESGELSLDESLQVFERGIAASRACARRLDDTRKRVQVLVEEAGGDFQLEFLDAEDEAALTASPDDGG